MFGRLGAMIGVAAVPLAVKATEPAEELTSLRITFNDGNGTEREMYAKANGDVVVKSRKVVPIPKGHPLHYESPDVDNNFLWLREGHE